MITIAVFNGQGGIGATSLVYHLAWMFAERGVSVLAADLDPQSNLTAMFLDEYELASIESGIPSPTAETPPLVQLSSHLALLPGNFKLALLEEEFARGWLAGGQDALQVTSRIHRVLAHSGQAKNASVVLIDAGPNLGAINRAALIAADFMVIPIVPDIFTAMCLSATGPRLSQWRREWKAMRSASSEPDQPAGNMKPIGYVQLHHPRWLSRMNASPEWRRTIPAAYANSILGEPSPAQSGIDQDPNRLAILKYYVSLMPMAMEARKPMFFLKSADGATGSHLAAVADCYRDFEQLTAKIAAACGIAYT